MTEAGPAIPVIAVTDRSADGGPALRVAVVSDGRPTEGGPARPVIVVTDGRPTQGNEPMPIIVATGAQASQVLAGPAIPVVVVSGSLNTNTPPVNTVLPAISGTLAIGQVLTTTDGTWTGTAPITYTYQWKRNGVDIGGETNNTYTLTTSDPGTAITVTVTATNAAGSASATSAAVNPSSLLTSLVAYWALEAASGNRVDATGRGNTLAPTGAPGNAAGKVANAVQLIAATPQFLSVASTADLSMGDVDFTIACWVYLDTKGAQRYHISKWVGVNGNQEYSVLYNNTPDRFEFYIAGFSKVVTANSLGSPSTATWYLIVCRHDATNNTITIQVNNGAVNSAATAGAFPALNGAGFAIGGARAATPAAGTNMDGRIDEAGVWKRVLSAAESTALYNAGNGVTYPFL